MVTIVMAGERAPKVSLLRSDGAIMRGAACLKSGPPNRFSANPRLVLLPFPLPFRRKKADQHARAVG